MLEIMLESPMKTINQQNFRKDLQTSQPFIRPEKRGAEKDLWVLKTNLSLINLFSKTASGGKPIFVWPGLNLRGYDMGSPFLGSDVLIVQNVFSLMQTSMLSGKSVICLQSTPCVCLYKKRNIS